VEQPTGSAGLGRFVDESKPIIEDARDELRDLEDRAPDDISADFTKLVDVFDRTVDKFGELRDAGTDRAKIEAVGAQLNTLEDQSDALPAKMGLEDCGERRARAGGECVLPVRA